MKIEEVLTGVQDKLHVSRVFGEPIERDGVTVIPVALVGGGGGGGGDNRPEGGSGGGFGLGAKPAGVYVIRGGDVSWQPAIDYNRVVTVGLFVLMMLIRSLRRRGKARAKAKRRRQKG